MSTALLTPTAQPEAGATIDLVVRSRSLQIRTPDEYVRACEEKLALDMMIKDRHANHDPVVAKAFETHRAATAARASDINPLEAAKKIYDDAIHRWQTEQRRIALAAAEAQRKEDERIAIEAREREIEEAEAAAADSGAMYQAEAIEEVRAIIERPVYVAPVHVPKVLASVPQVAGIRKRAELWAAKLDPSTTGALHKLIQFVSKNPQFEHLLQLNEQSANALAKAMKQTMNVPGLLAFDKNS